MRWLPTVVALVWTLAALSATEMQAPSLPGDDFDAWANSSWLESGEIPAGRARWNARDEIAALTRRQLAALLEDAAHAAEKQKEQKVADFRAALVDRAAIEKRGLTPLAPLLARIEAVRREAGRRMGLGDVAASVVPKPVIVSPGQEPGSITSRYFTPRRCHASHAATGAIGVA